MRERPILYIAAIAMIALGGCERPVDEPFDTKIRKACAAQFPRDFFRRSDCIGRGRMDHIRNQNFEAQQQAEGKQ